MAESSSRRRSRQLRRAQDNPLVSTAIDVPNTFTQWPKLHDTNDHLLHHMLDARPPKKITLTGGCGGAGVMYEKIARNWRMKEIVDATGWQFVCLSESNYNDQCLVAALVERWWDTTHTFHLPAMELGFTPYDFSAITGIMVGEGETVPYQQWDGDLPTKTQAKLNLLLEMFPFIEDPREWIEGQARGIKLSTIANAFSIMPFGEPDEYGLNMNEVYLLRLFFLYVIGAFWFSNSKGMCQFGFLELVRDPTQIGKYDWGSAILAFLYNNLDRVSRVEIGGIQGYAQVLQYWYWEVIGNPHPVLADKEYDVYPRILRWSQSRLSRTRQQVAHKVQIYRKRLEEVTLVSFNANPYGFSPLYARRDLQRVWQLSHARTVFGGAEFFVYYLGERLWHTLNSNKPFAIPYPPPEQMAPSEEDFIEWKTAGYIPLDLFALRHECDFQMWYAYWQSATTGVILPPRYKVVNDEYVNPLRGDHYDLLPAEYPGPSQGHGPVRTTQAELELGEYYTPDVLPIPGSEGIRLAPYVVDLPLSARPSSLRALAMHEKGLLGATRDHMVNMQRELDRANRRVQRARNALARLVGDADVYLPNSSSEDDVDLNSDR